MSSSEAFDLSRYGVRWIEAPEQGSASSQNYYLWLHRSHLELDFTYFDLEAIYTLFGTDYRSSEYDPELSLDQSGGTTIDDLIDNIDEILYEYRSDRRTQMDSG